MNRFTFLILIVLSFLPPIVYAIWIRNTEKIDRESWMPIILCFIWGATIAVVAAVILEIILEIPLSISIKDGNVIGLIMAILIAPFAEELTKPLALRMKVVNRELDELEDGLIYGAVAGLGFSATENMLYGWSFLLQGKNLGGYSVGLFFIVFLIFMLIRSFGGCLLHATATAWTGYGIGKSVMEKTSVFKIFPFFVLAFFLHSCYNLLVAFEINGVVIGFVIAMFLVFVSVYVVRKKIQFLDSKSR